MQEIFDRKTIFQRFAKINFDFLLYNKISSEIIDEMQDYKVFFCKNYKNQEKITQISGYQLQNCEYNTIILEENDQKNIAKIKNLPKNDGIVAINALHNVNYLQEYLMAIFENLNIDGVFCGNDLMAVGAIATLEAHGLSCPEDVKIVGFDDSLIARTTKPTLTSIRQDISGLGESAAQLMLQLLQGETVSPVILPTEIVRRGSC